MADDVMEQRSEGDSARWPILDKLAGFPEADTEHRMDRRRFLLQSPESEDIKELDAALQEILRLELRLELGLDQSHPFNDSSFVTLCDESPSFGQYLKTHLYFGVRFAGGRIANPCMRRREEPCTDRILDNPGGGDESRGLNIWPLGLPRPPLCEDTRNIPAAKAWERFERTEEQARKSTSDLDKAFGFLRDPDLGEGETLYELWLRGLYAPKAKANYEALTEGLSVWAREREEFYLFLDGKDRASWKDGGWYADNPLVARFAVADLPRLARILRVDVSSDALVSCRARSWLLFIGARGGSRPSDADHKRREAVLRGAFEFGCDLIRNAVELAAECYRRWKAPGDYPEPGRDKSVRGRHALDWHAVYDEEQEEIERQRKERQDGN